MSTAFDSFIALFGQLGRSTGLNTFLKGQIGSFEKTISQLGVTNTNFSFIFHFSMGVALSAVLLWIEILTWINQDIN